jgi:hypothetical protein
VIIWDRNSGPCFGLQDLCISNNFGTSRQHSYENRIINRENFEIEEYEVFQVIDTRPRFSICYFIYMIFMGIFGIIKWIFMGIFRIIKWVVLILLCALVATLLLAFYAMPIIL